jgi:hypothetical protein
VRPLTPLEVLKIIKSGRVKKGGIDVDPGFRDSMIECAARLEIEIQQKIDSFLVE